jgi:hypothetical protein
VLIVLAVDARGDKMPFTFKRAVALRVKVQLEVIFPSSSLFMDDIKKVFANKAAEVKK